ncbi:sulfide/dihydroorotate dehydrogenase-like FAD/NAD-binding protein [Methanocella arvoryzae]|uniref:Predicted oxidoreductase (Cytochrome-c3 hydrogenase, gamma subunit family) n=1 Tax=Methanocella arvoryzae (strain DSM 22066 / NBRC 105507 / MRE50) TaxID=351160 RepID=Q0W0S5_METAR|nr:sulfide/dihydroorotate dehydrogenase-like FAD/NAD-binding protein [Methanocella arvoryzae]CAJ38018.1 predicted oxidoreductase (cytochrome-c3 hydrogenase, gamma subunit family) [Methanocella arvoryzae MRE50]
MYNIVSKTELATFTTQLVVEAPDVARKAQAGQFVVVRAGEKGERIPLTIADYDREKGTITMVIQPVGSSTGKICSLCEGSNLHDVAGPLGNASEIIENGLVVCIGGGIGIAPIYPIAREFKARGNKVISIIGARSAEYLFWEDKLRAVSDELHVATDDGSKGIKGFVTQPLADLISSGIKIDRVIAIGPLIMMKNIANATRPHGIKTIVSLNPIMVDGTGMCGSCRVSVGGQTKFSCVDGPEFDAHLVDFDGLMARGRMYGEEEKVSTERYQHEKNGVPLCLTRR